MSAFLRRTRGVQLLDTVLGAGKMDREVVEESLGVSGADLEAFLAGTTRMPPELRLRLASLVVADFPEHARAAHRVRQAAEAEVAFRNTTTVTHLWAPPSRVRY
jgi:hypothetical protein